MSFNQFRSNVVSSKTTFRVGFVNADLLYLVSLDEDLANALLAGSNALPPILAGFLWGFCIWLLPLHPGIRRNPEIWRIPEGGRNPEIGRDVEVGRNPANGRNTAVGRNPEVERRRDSFQARGFMVMAASRRGCWYFFVDAIAFWRDNEKGFLGVTVIISSGIVAIICTGFPFSLNFALASSNQGAYSIFGTNLGVAPFNWSADAINSISAAVEHVARGSDYDIFDGLARKTSLQLGQAVEAVGCGSDLGLNVSKQAGCWWGDRFCLNGSIGDLQMHFRVDTSQIGVLSRRKVWIEGRSRISQIDVDEVMAQTSQKYSNDNMTAIDTFEFGFLSQNGSTTPITWSTFSALSTSHDTDSTTFWADASGRPGNNSFPEGFNLVNAHLTLTFFPATILPSTNGSTVNSMFGEWPFRYGNITTAYSKPRLLASRDDSRLCVGNTCTPFGGADQITPAAERLFQKCGIPRDFVFLSSHAADGMISGPVRLLRNKALMVNDFVAEGNTLDVSSYAIPEVVRWFALSAFATTALPGRIASGYFARKWVLSGVTGETTPPVTGDSVHRTNAVSTIGSKAEALSRVTIGVDQQKRLINIMPILAIGAVFLFLVFVRLLIHFVANSPRMHNTRFRYLLTILDPFVDLELLRRLDNRPAVEPAAAAAASATNPPTDAITPGLNMNGNAPAPETNPKQLRPIITRRKTSGSVFDWYVLY